MINVNYSLSSQGILPYYCVLWFINLTIWIWICEFEKACVCVVLTNTSWQYLTCLGLTWILTLNYLFHLQEAVYNQTINIVEVSEGLDGETFFLYVFLGAACVLGLVLGQQALSSLARRRSPRSQSKPLETGTANDVDYDWLPKEVVNQLSE